MSSLRVHLEVLCLFIRRYRIVERYPLEYFNEMHTWQAGNQIKSAWNTCFLFKSSAESNCKHYNLNVWFVIVIRRLRFFSVAKIDIHTPVKCGAIFLQFENCFRLVEVSLGNERRKDEQKSSKFRKQLAS